MEIVRVDEKTYLNELVTYHLHFESYKYDCLINKLIEVHVNVFQKNSHVQVTDVVTSFWSEPIVTIIKKLEPIKWGVELAIVSCTLPLPIEPMEILVVVVSIPVKALEKPVTPKPIPLIILEIGVGVEVTLIDSITHASKVFKTLDTILKDTPITKRLEFQLVPLVESINTINEQLVDTIGEQHVDDLVACVKHVVLGD